MTCYSPLKGYRSAAADPDTRKRGVVFNPLKALNSTNVLTFPCGKCYGCRLDRAEAWAIRCVHESQMHEANSFVTLTFDRENLPADYSVNVRTFQLFMKRLRSEVSLPLRYFACGEYGSENLRPHYHALINGFDFAEDRKLERKSEFGPVFTSDLLAKVWPFGKHEIGHVTFKSARYVAGYIYKKINGEPAASHYLRTHPDSGLVVKVEPEFCVQSRRPGIGATWFDKYKDDCFPSDFLVVEGRQVPVPNYYLRKLEAEQAAASAAAADAAPAAAPGAVAPEPAQAPAPSKFPPSATSFARVLTAPKTAVERIKRERKRKALPHKWNSAPDRLQVREVIKRSRTRSLHRPL